MKFYKISLLILIIILSTVCRTVEIAPPPETTYIEPAPIITSVVTRLSEIVSLDSDAICPSVSFDGNLVAFSGDSEAYTAPDRNWDIYVVEVMGGSLIKVTEDKELIWEQNPCWTPDGKVVYDSDAHDNINIWMRPYTGSGASSMIAAEYPNSFYPSFSADGKKMAYIVGGYQLDKSFLNSFNTSPAELDMSCEQWYYQGQNKAPQIWVLDLETGSRFLLTEGIHPAFNPQGDKIAFSKLSSGKFEIWMIDLDGSHLTRLAATGGHDIEPCWSPSGRNLAFVSGKTGAWKIWIAQGDEGYPVQVTTGESNEGHPSWGVGGRLFFHSDAGFDQIFKIWMANIRF